jgi:hypothetical protein
MLTGDVHLYTVVNMNLKRTTVFLTEKQVAALGKESQKTGAKPAEIMRRALDAYLKLEGK